MTTTRISLTQEQIQYSNILSSMISNQNIIIRRLENNISCGGFTYKFSAEDEKQYNNISKQLSIVFNIGKTIKDEASKVKNSISRADWQRIVEQDRETCIYGERANYMSQYFINVETIEGLK